MFNGDQVRDRRAEGESRHMRLLDAKRVEQAHRVRREVGHGVGRVVGIDDIDVGSGAQARVAMVVADDPKSATGEHFAEPSRPKRQVREPAGEQQEHGVVPVSKCLVSKLQRTGRSRHGSELVVRQVVSHGPYHA